MQVEDLDLTCSASDEVIAHVALCTFILVNVQVQILLGFATGFSDGLLEFVKSECTPGYTYYVIFYLFCGSAIYTLFRMKI